MEIFTKRLGFTAIELLLTISIIAISTAIAIPLYRQYLVRNDLEIARQNVAQGIQRAKFLSQVSMNDSRWGFSTDAVPGRGVLFMGDSYATRDTDFDELYSLPDTIEVTGLTEVSFSKIYGLPNQDGTITLRTIYGDERTIVISLDDEGNVSIPDDWLEVCVNPYGEDPQTVQIPDSLWEFYSEQGALLGPCGEGEGGGEGGEGGGEGPDFVIDGDTVSPTEDFSCELKVLGAALNIGYDMPVTLRVKFVGGAGWTDPFGQWNSPTTANINDGEEHEYECPTFQANDEIDMEGISWIKKWFWYSGEKDSHWKVWMSQDTDNQDNDNIIVLRDGDAVPDVPGFGSQESVQDYVAPYVDLETDLVNLGSNQALYLFELWTEDLESEAADFQDLVLLLNITTP